MHPMKIIHETRQCDTAREALRAMYVTSKLALANHHVDMPREIIFRHIYRPHYWPPTIDRMSRRKYHGGTRRVRGIVGMLRNR